MYGRKIKQKQDKMNYELLVFIPVLRYNDFQKNMQRICFE